MVAELFDTVAKHHFV